MSINPDFFNRLQRLKDRLRAETNPIREKQLIRHINMLLDSENKRLTDLIWTIFKNIEDQLEDFDSQFMLLGLQQAKRVPWNVFFFVFEKTHAFLSE